MTVLQDPTSGSMLVGAHYYAWYSGKWSHATVRGNLVQKQFPSLGWYNNTLSGLDTVRKHFALAKTYGIDFLPVSWNGFDLGPYLDIAKEEGIKLCIHYETLNRVKTTWITEVHTTYLTDLMRIHKWFDHEAYLKIQDKPVLMYYAMRAGIKAVVQDFIERIRAIGQVYLVGDVVFLNDPESDLISAFDAIFGYNMYINNNVDLGNKPINHGYTGKAYLNYIKPFEESYLKVCNKTGTHFWPTVLPGYNDRGVRLSENHYVIPREGGEFFKDYLDYSLRFLEDDILLVTSFNEWYEDTQLEQCIGAAHGLKSINGEDLTQGSIHDPYGDLYLKILSDFKKQNETVDQKTGIDAVLYDKRPVDKRSIKVLITQWQLLYYIHTHNKKAVSSGKLDASKRVYMQVTERLHSLGVDVSQYKATAQRTYSYTSNLS